jgi:SAM-dependent methyltransferase
MATLDLERIYLHRFDGVPVSTKLGVWKVISSYILNEATRYRGSTAPLSVLDPACGDGEFLNGCVGRLQTLVGCDLRSRSPSLLPTVQFHQGGFGSVNIGQCFDLIWISNLLEHLPSPEAVQDFLQTCSNYLTRNGLVTIMGPNIKYCAGDYWDFADHLLPLSHLTVLEHLASAGLEAVAVTPRFLPYSFRSRLPSHPLLVQAYLKAKPAWPLLGKQFLIHARPASP